MLAATSSTIKLEGQPTNEMLGSKLIERHAANKRLRKFCNVLMAGILLDSKEPVKGHDLKD